jgi:predicted TIM-barrel fold metal-dependent hydrolase
MSVPFPIVDSHVHFFLTSVLTDPTRAARGLSPAMVARMRERFAKNLAKRGEVAMGDAPETPGDYARLWLRELDANGIEAAVFLSLSDDATPFREFLAAAPGRFIGYGYVDPLDPGAPDELARQVRDYGYRGLKLVTTTQKFHPYDERAYPLWERAESLGIPVLIHCGVSIGYNADLRFANPIDLQPVLRDFPGLRVLLAHFGTGFFREALLLAYQCDNILLDTSSSNIWMRNQGTLMTLTDVFARALDAAGPERLVFGTDSSYFPRGFRRDILDSQLRALEELKVPEEQQAMIFAGNIRKVLGQGRDGSFFPPLTS